MRAVDIKIKKTSGGIAQLKASFSKNWKFYMQEALGLAIFMVSACFFSGILFGKNGFLVTYSMVPYRQYLLGLMMGLTALYIFYSPFTSPSGSHINPAVTLAFLRVGKIGRWDALFYIIFQFIGGTLAVYFMAIWMGENLTASPLHYVVTIPGKYGTTAAATTELIIAFIMMSMVLFTADHSLLKNGFFMGLAEGAEFFFVSGCGGIEEHAAELVGGDIRLVDFGDAQFDENRIGGGRWRGRAFAEAEKSHSLLLNAR